MIRLGSKRDVEEIKEHPYMAGVDWDKVYRREYIPPPIIQKSNYLNFFEQIAQFPETAGFFSTVSIGKVAIIHSEHLATMYKNFVFLRLFYEFLLTKMHFCGIIVIVLNTDLS